MGLPYPYIDLTDMHTMLDEHATEDVNPSDWIDMRFFMVTYTYEGGSTNGRRMYGARSQQGRSVYHKREAVGCTAAYECNLGHAKMCFDHTSIQNDWQNSWGSSYMSRPKCKSRTHKYYLAEPQHFRAYRLCDDGDDCTGAHQCKESGPVNHVSFYTCKPSAETPGGCRYDERDIMGSMCVIAMSNPPPCAAPTWPSPHSCYRCLRFDCALCVCACESAGTFTA